MRVTAGRNSPKSRFESQRLLPMVLGKKDETFVFRVRHLMYTLARTML